MRLLQFISKDAKTALSAVADTQKTLKGMRLLRSIVEDVGDKYGLTVQQVCGRKRGKSYVDCRAEIAIKLRKSGYTYPEIAEALDRDTSSIQHLVKRRKRAETSTDTSGA